MNRRLAIAAIFVGPSAALLALTAAIYFHFRIRVPDRLDDAARAEVIACLRRAVDGAAPAPPHGLAQPLDHGGPILVELWSGGIRVARVVGQGDTLAAATAAAAQALAASPALARLDAAARAAARLRVDVVVARGPLLERPELLALFALHPGLEGLGVTLADGREILLGPDDVVARKLTQARRPIAALPELDVGLDRTRADRVLAEVAGLAPAALLAARRARFRFRTDAFVERPLGERAAAPLPLYRNAPPPPELSAANLRAAALAGGHYLVDHLAANGRYVYEMDLTTGKGTDPTQSGAYSLPRHAGTTYFLAELYRHTHAEFLREPIERAFAHLAALIDEGGCKGALPSGAAFACVVDHGEQTAQLGSSALAVVALVEYQRATGDARYAPMARALAEWILSLQRPDGSFVHQYEVASGRRDEATQQLYYSGEAALALARLATVDPDPRYLDAAHRALDDLVGWYDFFAGGFFYGEEHWTCIAAEAIYPAVTDDRYREFCDGYGEFLRRQEAAADDYPDQPDVAGTYGFTPFVLPANTPAGSRTEAMISAYQLGLHHGAPDPALREQILRSVRYSLGQQVRPDSSWAVAEQADGLGAIPASAIDQTVRIDYVQHVCSSLLRAADLLESPP